VEPLSTYISQCGDHIACTLISGTHELPMAEKSYLEGLKKF